MLDGFELAAGAWERAVLPARLDRYEPSMLDMLCLAGEVGWARLSPPDAALTPAWCRRRRSRSSCASTPTRGRRCARCDDPDEAPLSGDARHRAGALRTRGASFFGDLAPACASTPTAAARARRARRRRAGGSDGFSGLRTLVGAAQRPAGAARSTQRTSPDAGRRWPRRTTRRDRATPRVERQARALLRRYGIVFRRLLTRETERRALARAGARLPAARGARRDPRRPLRLGHGRRAVRAARRGRAAARSPAHAADGSLLTISAADPLNLTGIVTAGERIRAAGRNRIAYRDGVRRRDGRRRPAPLEPLGRRRSRGRRARAEPQTGD